MFVSQKGLIIMKYNKLRELFQDTTHIEGQKVDKQIEKLQEIICSYYKIVEDFILPVPGGVGEH